MNYPTKLFVNENDHDTILDCMLHYEYVERVTDGWMFFEFESDYQVWINQE